MDLFTAEHDKSSVHLTLRDDIKLIILHTKRMDYGESSHFLEDIGMIPDPQCCSWPLSIFVLLSPLISS